MFKSTSLFAALLTTAALLPAQSGTFKTYGMGCAGSAGTDCISANTDQPFNGNIGSAANFALPFDSGQNVVICGVELICKLTAPGSKLMGVWIYDADPVTGAPGKSIAAGQMPVTDTLTTNRAIFPSPVILMPNTKYFTVFDNTVSLNLPIMKTGTTNVHYFGGPPTWRGPFSSAPWNYAILCCGAGKVPQISNTNAPNINASFSIDLSGARASTSALLSLGFGQTNVDLSIIQAPGCTLYTNPLYLIGQTTDAQGTTAVKFPVPNTASLVGLVLHSQYGVLDPTNAAGIVFTAGGEITIGK